MIQLRAAHAPIQYKYLWLLECFYRQGPMYLYDFPEVAARCHKTCSHIFHRAHNIPVSHPFPTRWHFLDLQKMLQEKTLLITIAIFFIVFSLCLIYL